MITIMSQLRHYCIPDDTLRYCHTANTTYIPPSLNREGSLTGLPDRVRRVTAPRAGGPTDRSGDDGSPTSRPGDDPPPSRSGDGPPPPKSGDVGSPAPRSGDDDPSPPPRSGDVGPPPPRSGDDDPSPPPRSGDDDLSPAAEVRGRRSSTTTLTLY